jgi:hypothetical protein
MNNVVIATFRHRHEGELARSFLSDAGIRSVMSADEVHARRDVIAASLVRVIVRVQDAERARSILANTADVAFE